MPTLGGQARRLAPDGNFPVWHPDGRTIAYVGGPEVHRSILEVPAEGGTARAILSSDTSSWEIVHVRYAPHGRWISFDTAESEIYLMPVAGGRPHRLISGTAHVWAPSGTRLYYCVRDSRGGTRLQAVAIDEATGVITGEPSTIGLMTGFLRDLAVSRDGHQLALTETEGAMNLTRLPLSDVGNAPAGSEEILSAGQVLDGQPSVSHDGQRIAYVSSRLGRDQIWMFDVGTKQMEVLQLPGEDIATVGPHWHPDGRRLIAERILPNGRTSLWWIAADGSFADELNVDPPPVQGPNAEGWPIAPNGRSLIYGSPVDGHAQLFTFDLETRRSQPLTFSPDDKFSAAWSPDGRWVVYTSNANGSSQLFRIPSGGGQAEPLTQGADRVRHMFYSPDGKWLYFQPNHLNIYRMTANGGPPEQVTHFPESGLFLEEPTISPDGRYLVYCRSNGGASIWRLQLGNVETKGR
jgi:TolB protein